MSLDPHLPIAPARVKALLLPVGRIKTDRFASFVSRLQSEHVVHLRDITADGRPHRNMFSPLAYPDGAMLYDLITHVPPPSHLALTPFDLYREPMAVVALADGKELRSVTFSKRHPANGTGPTIAEKNVRALYQELEDLRDQYPKALVHQVLVFDYVAPTSSITPIPEGIFTIPPAEDSLRTTIKTVMCNISSLVLAEMTTLAKSFEAMTSIDSPVHYSGTRPLNGELWPPGEGGTSGLTRRNSQFALPQANGPFAPAGIADRSHARMSMPPVPSRPTFNSSSSTPGRPSTPVKSGMSNPPMTSDGVQSEASSTPSTPDRTNSRPDTAQPPRDRASSKVSVHGFGPGGANDKWRLRGKGRVSIVIGSMYLQAGRWSDSLKELTEGATASRSLNDHIWHGKALELILTNLFLLAWSGLEFQLPQVCLPTPDAPNRSSWAKGDSPPDSSQPKHLRNLQIGLPELLDRIINLYSRKRAESEKLPHLPFAEATIRFCKILSALHLCGGELNQQCLDMIVSGKLPDKELTTSPRLHIVPSRQHIANLLFDAFPSSQSFASDLLTTVDRASILSGIAAVLGPLGFRRKKAMVIRELVSVLISGLVEARTRGAADAGVHPAAGLMSISPGVDSRNGLALDLSEGDIEHGIEPFLDVLCRSYGIVGHEKVNKLSGNEPTNAKNTDEAIMARIYGQSSTRFFGFTGIKLNILRACINFSEALPDLNSVMKFSSDLLRTAGSGIAPGPLKEDSSPMIYAEEQARLVANIGRTWGLSQRLGLGSAEGEYWDEFLIRGINLEPLPSTRTPIPHAQSSLPGASAGRASQDVDPFIYNPFLKKPDETVEHYLVAEEPATFRLNLQNTYDMEVDIESIRLETTGVAFEAAPETTRLGPNRTQLLKLKGRPKERGHVKVIGAIVKVRGCRERRFPVFSKPWKPVKDEKIKVKGLAALEEPTELARRHGPKLETDILNLTAIQAQPLITVKSTTLPQSSIMILEGERKSFSVTLQNLSPTPVDFMLFSFKDSTQAPLQAALNNRDATPADLHEHEFILMKKQALRSPRNNNQKRYIAAGGEATFEFEVLGKAGLTHATVQVDYTHLGVPREEVTEQFYTRQVSIDLTTTVNASVELSRADVLPVNGNIPRSFWARFGGSDSANVSDYCLLSMDLRNAWPSQMVVHLEGDDGLVVDENILPGNTNRVLMPMKRVFLEEPHASIPSLNPSRDRQFVVSTSKISPDMERANREAFWYREKILERLRVKWTTTSAPKRNGTVELRNLRLTPRMVEAVKVDEVGIDISVENADGADGEVAYVDESMQVKVHVTNRTSKPILPIVRLVPALCHRSLNVALDYTRKLGWNGTLQQLLPRLEGRASTDFVIGMTTLCRGEFEFAATVEEVQVWEDPKAGGKDEDSQEGRQRSDTQTMMDAALGVQERRVWHSRQPFILTVKDRE